MDQQMDEDQVSVTITALGDGTYTVSMAGDTDGEDAGDEPQTADNIDDALSMVKEMLGAEDQEADDTSDGNATLSPDDAKAAWNQMASKKKPM